MDLRNLLTPTGWSPRVADKAQLLAELARRTADATGLPQRVIHDGLLVREALGSIGIGGGVAILHAPVGGIRSVLCYFARLERSMDFDAMNEQPVDLVCLLLAPLNAVHMHLQAQACVSRPFHDLAASSLLRQAEDASTMYSALTRSTRA